ncbi:MAG: LysR family transcriptional regulator [Pseudomonadota bacterium]
MNIRVFRMMKLTELAAFVRISETGSLAAAARELKLSTTTVSERLASLESAVGALLIRRTTRSLSLTEEGEAMLEGARRLLEDARALEASLADRTKSLTGVVRFSAPRDIGRRRVLPLVETFLKAHPDVSIDVLLSDALVDIGAEGVDFAVRDGPASDRSLVSRPLLENRRVVCASPDYLARRGAPERPEDLADHDCLVLRAGGRVDRFWRFIVDGRERGAPLRIARSADDSELIADWCRAGLGLAVKSFVNVEDDLASGALKAVLTEFAPPPGGFNLVYPATEDRPRRVSMLIDAIEAGLRSPDAASEGAAR